MTALPPRQLHLPDLPEVSVQIGGPAPAAGLGEAPGQAPRAQPSLVYGLRQALSTYLPLLLMALLAASTAWLIKLTPQPPGPAGPAVPREAPDYTMAGFSIQRFGPDGREVLRIGGDLLRHYPSTDRLEIEGVRIHAVAPDGRQTDAQARRAVVKGDGSEAQLLGAVQVVSQLGNGQVLEMRGESLQAFRRFERLYSALPVLVRSGGTETRAGGLDYNHHERQLQLLGPVRSTVQPPGRAAVRPASSADAPADATLPSASPVPPRP